MPPLDDCLRGKAVKYLVDMMDANPARSFAMGVVTDLQALEVWEATRAEDGRLAMRASRPCTLNPSMRSYAHGMACRAAVGQHVCSTCSGLVTPVSHICD